MAGPQVLEGLREAEMLPARTEGAERGQRKQVLSSQASAVFWKYFPLGKGDSMIQFLYCKCLLPSGRNQNVSERGAPGSEERTGAPEGRALVLEGGTEKHIGVFPGFES